MPPKKKTNGDKGKRVTRYTYDEVKDPRIPETGHTALLPADEQVVTVPMDNGWTKAMKVGELPASDRRPVVIDMDPAGDPTLFWSGKRNRREVPILPLQRNEIVSESRIAQIIERARKSASEKAPQMTFASIFSDLEKQLRESDKSKRIEFYTHEEGWKNKLICGDSLHVMESLLHYEALRGNVQMIYIDPPYGIKYDSNFQQRIDSIKNDQADQADEVLTIKAFRDTWSLGIHSYLSYLQERLYLSRELLSDSGSVFVQISDVNIHLVMLLMDEVFGASNRCSIIPFAKTSGQESNSLATVCDYLLWYAKDASQVTYRQLYGKLGSDFSDSSYNCVELPDGTWRRLTSSEGAGESPMPKGRRFRTSNIMSQGETEKGSLPFTFQGTSYKPSPGNHWKVKVEGLRRLAEKSRLLGIGKTLVFKRYIDDFSAVARNNVWMDTLESTFAVQKVYAVQTSMKVVTRCILMTTNPGDLVFDPTCGSGTTAVCAERNGRRWITCDTSRVAINVARQRMLSSIFPHFRTRNGKVSSGFVYETAKRITASSVAYDKEPETVELVDQPEEDSNAARLVGPFEVMSLGRYSVEDWKGFVATRRDNEIEAAKLENYIEVICRLYRKDAAVQGASGFVHAISESHDEKIALSVGPLSGRVTAKQVNDAVQDALASGIVEVHILGWAFEVNVGEVKAQLEKRGKVKVILQMIRQDTLAEGLKITKPESLFSPLALPDITVEVKKHGKEAQVIVRLNGVAVFDRKNRTTDYKQAASGYVSAWYLDEDYDGDCFVDCQMFFDFKKAPNLKALGVQVEPEELEFHLESQPFSVGGYRRIAVKVVDIYGNESTVVREL